MSPGPGRGAPQGPALRVAGVGVWAPEERVTLEVLAAESGVQAAELRTHLGFAAKHRPPGERDISPWHLQVAAARAALADAHVAPAGVDLVLSVGRARIDYTTFSLSLAVMKELGFGGGEAIGVDMADFTGGPLLTGLRVLDAKLRADPRRDTALLTTHHRASDLIDHAAPPEAWHWPHGDGAAALFVRRAVAEGEEDARGAEGQGPALLGHAFASEGKGSGLLALRRETIDEGPDPDGWFEKQWAQRKRFTFRDPGAWFSDFASRCARRVPEVVRKALTRAGVDEDAVALVQCGYLYPGVEARVREALGAPLGARLRAHNDHGLLGGVELGFALPGLLADPALRGKAVVLAQAGAPADFGAAVLRL